jgi:hypothetical protein
MAAKLDDEWFVARARELFCEQGHIEIEEKAPVSRGDAKGAYVQAWVWVPADAGD